MRPTPTPASAPDGSFGGDRPEPGRFDGIRRDYTPADVERLAGSFRVQHTLADMGARRLWQLLKTEPHVNTLGALTGMQALQQVKAGLKAIYLSGWQVAADANSAATMYPDQSLYPVDSVPTVVRRINNALRRADQIATLERKEGKADDQTHYMAPIVADAEAGFGGALNAYELMRAMIEAGAAGVHFEDQLASEKKCGHLGGKVLVPIAQHIRTLNAARLAADVEGVPTVLLCRTDAESAQLLTSRRGRARPALHLRRPHAGGLLPHQARRAASSTRSPAAWPTRPMPTCCGGRPPTPTSTTRASSPRRSSANSRARCSPTTARPPSTGSGRWASRRRRSSSARSAPWATSSSS